MAPKRIGVLLAVFVSACSAITNFEDFEQGGPFGAACLSMGRCNNTLLTQCMVSAGGVTLHSATA